MYYLMQSCVGISSSICLQVLKKTVLKVHFTHLNQGIFTQQWAGECGCCSQESRICHFLHSLPDGQNQGSVDERYDDIGIKLI